MTEKEHCPQCDAAYVDDDALACIACGARRSGVQFDRERNGSLHDRGAADSYYRRPCNPHWYPGGTYKGDPITNLTAEEIAEYERGFDENERSGSHKDLGYGDRP